MTQQPNVSRWPSGTIGLDTIITPFGKAEGVLGGSGMYISVWRPRAGPGAAWWQWPARISTDEHGRASPAKPGAWRRGGARPGKRSVGAANTTVTSTAATLCSPSWACWRDLTLKCRPTAATAGTVFLANIDPGSQLRVLEQMEKPEFVVTDTMNYWISSDLDRLREVIRRSDC